MPVEGWKSITVSEQTYKQLEQLAEKTHRTIPKLVEFLIEEVAKKAIA